MFNNTHDIQCPIFNLTRKTLITYEGNIYLESILYGWMQYACWTI